MRPRSGTHGRMYQRPEKRQGGRTVAISSRHAQGQPDRVGCTRAARRSPPRPARARERPAGDSRFAGPVRNGLPRSVCGRRYRPRSAMAPRSGAQLLRKNLRALNPRMLGRLWAVRRRGKLRTQENQREHHPWVNASALLLRRRCGDLGRTSWPVTGECSGLALTSVNTATTRPELRKQPTLFVSR